jgi:SAM-dependent methyltransferase
MTDERPNRWETDDYDEKHGFVYEYGASVVEFLDPQPGERILDLGCGTGHLTREIAAQGADVLGIDASAEMIETASEEHPDLEFRQADARTFEPDGAFDAVFSNAALHWIPEADHDAVLEMVQDALAPDGRFVAEMGGAGNIQQIATTAIDELAQRGYEATQPWYFPSIGEYTPRIEEYGMEVTRAVLFDRPTELEDGARGLENWLGMFGDSIFEGIPEGDQRAVIEATEDRLREDLYDAETETWTADYRRLRFVAQRT